MKKSLVIGAGPAGLMAAEMLADAGHGVVVAEAKPSVGRKFLMAGKSGLNLTKDEPDTQFQAAFGDSKGWLSPILETFGPSDVRKWAETLGQTTFVGSTGRVFPHSMKASPLLRSWLGRLADKGVTFRTRSRWVGWSGNRFTFETPEGLIDDTPDGTVLALGGASWAKLGADGQWATLLEQRGIPVNPFVPSNMGITLTWSDHMANHFGQPIKQVRMIVGDRSNIGECVLSRSGLEGSLVYQFSAQFRNGLKLRLDLCPDLTLDEVTRRIAKQPAKASRTNLLRKAFHFDAVKVALVMELARDTPTHKLARVVKGLDIPYTGVAPLDLAISVGGGVAQQALTPDLMLKSEPGVFCAGEMLDWEAPTGGYLLTACLATGRAAGLGAAQHLSELG